MTGEAYRKKGLARKLMEHVISEYEDKCDGIYLFYTAVFDNVFYAEDFDCFIVKEEGDYTVLQSVLCEKKTALSDVLARLTPADKKLRLGFVPLDEDMYMCTSEVYDGGDDYRLFYRGEALEAIERDRLYFPELSHA